MYSIFDFIFFWQLDVGQENKNLGEVAVSSLSLLSDTLSIMPLTIKKKKSIKNKNRNRNKNIQINKKTSGDEISKKANFVNNHNSYFGQPKIILNKWQSVYVSSYYEYIYIKISQWRLVTI